MKSAILRKAFLTLALAVMTVIGLSAGTLPSLPAPQVVALAGTLPQGLAQAQVSGNASADQQLQLSISLPLRSSALLKMMLRNMYDPTSPEYHQYLSPATFSLWFAPTQATVNRVTSWLKAQGLHVGSVASNHLLVDASGSVAQVDQAFQVQIKNYNLNGKSFYAPDRNPLLPTSISDAIQGINGLDNMATWQPRLQPNVPATGPAGGFTPSELRTAYDFNGIIGNGDQGDGQTVAIFELDGYKSSDITNYESHYRKRARKPSVFSRGLNGRSLPEDGRTGQVSKPGARLALDSARDLMHA